MSDLPERISGASLGLAMIATKRALAASTVEVAPAAVEPGWSLPATDALMRVSGGADVPDVYVRVRVAEGGDARATAASGAVADADAFVRTDATGAPMILPPIEVADVADDDARGRAVQLAAAVAARVPIYEALVAMQVPLEGDGT